ncbi:geranylgeranyl pyrophosphate synthetase [Dissophora globulifera]|uniref:Geranylgeranyl pyrophosphate synthetase n=1 Tax=Dissophora globulifera TaxID=979702 RepID=A0A9P6UY97_9FUNG|nr:geranylgeranyl pyrophosphate synthetase [Dissophora globulifera]
MAIPALYPTNHEEPALLEPYTSSRPEKELRTELIESFNIWLQVPAEELAIITKVIKMLHTAILLVDDIEDGSVLRRGEPAAHKIFGIPATINCANYVYFMALAELAKIHNSDMISIFTGTLKLCFASSGMDLLWRDSMSCPTEEEYVAMVIDKRGGLFRLAVKLMQAASGSQVDYVPLVELLAIPFHIRDDYMNLQPTQSSSNKTFCEDLTEGKFSFPIIHSIHADPNSRTLLNILKQRPTEIELKKHAVKIIERTNSFAYCRQRLAEYKQIALAEIQRLGGNARLEVILDRMIVPTTSVAIKATNSSGAA